MKKALLFVIITLTGFNLFSQTIHLKSVSETQELTKSIAKLFQENKTGEAFEVISLHWPLHQNELADLRSQTIRYFNLFDERFGKTRGIVKTNNETIKDIALRETYLILYDYHAIRLIMTYYKNDQGWVINTFKWDDSYAEKFR